MRLSSAVAQRRGRRPALLTKREDPRPACDRPVRPGAAQGRDRDQERPRGRAAAPRVHRSLRKEDEQMKLILTSSVHLGLFVGALSASLVATALLVRGVVTRAVS